MLRGAAFARTPLIVTLTVVAALAVAICAAAWWAQERLIFFAQPIASTRHLPASASPLEIVATDGTRLRGWIVAAASVPAPTLIYFGGNAEEVSWALADARWPRDWTRVALNYRGYGESEGSPGERALVADASAIYDAIAKRADVDSKRIVVVGRSLGTGVAVALASVRPLAAAILVSPYDSLAAVGRMHYPFLPVSLLLRHRFDSIALAGAIRVPLCAIVASDDTIIPPQRSRALFDRWGGPKRWHAIDGADHNDVSTHDAYWRTIAAFLDEQRR
jgi:hypothetical protein